MPNRYLIFLFLLSLLPLTGYPQQYFFKKYSLEEGLPQSDVYCLMQDRRGYIWMGTNGGGVTRFDGFRFETFTQSDGIANNAVRNLFEDSKGNIWIGTNGGLTFYDGYSFQNIGKDEGFTDETVLKIKESSDGSIWVATNDKEKGIFRLIKGDSLTITSYSYEEGLVNYLALDIFEDSSRNLWLAMVSGVNIMEFNKDNPALPPVIKTLEVKSDNTIIFTSIDQDIDGTIWLGSYENGVFRVTWSEDKKTYIVKPSSLNDAFPGLRVWDIKCRNDGETWIATEKNGVFRLRDDKITGEFNNTNGLVSDQILQIMEDKEGNIWFASSGNGALMYSGERFMGYTRDNGLKGNQVFSLIPGPSGLLYTATDEGLTSFIKEGPVIKRSEFFTTSNGLNDAVVNSLTRREDKIWIGTNNGINILDGNEVKEFPLNYLLPERKINCLFNDSRNNLWIGTIGGYCRYSGKDFLSLTGDEGLIHNEVQTIIEDSTGRIWMGTIGGLVRLTGEKQTEYTDFNKTDGLSVLWINCLAEDPAGNIWIGTFGGGIFRFDVKKDSVPISLFAEKSILSSNNINSLLFVSDTSVIAGSDRGFDLIYLDNQQKIRNVIHYGINDGFTGGENNLNAVTTDSDGFIWFGTKKGLVKFNPKIDTRYSSSPAASITGIKILFNNVNWKSRNLTVSQWSNLPEKLVLSYIENHVTFQYTGFSFPNPSDLIFSYILEPQNQEWSPFISAREIPFSGLEPGDYLFKVVARNKYGVTGKASEFRFSIKPPFWKTRWFLLSLGVMVILILITVIRLRERTLIREKVKLESIVKERTREVVEQKDEVARQRDVVMLQKKEITDSLNYAETIQMAVLPDEEMLKKAFSDYFIIYRPKDIVSGDFYWMSMKDDIIVFTAADCTGHGVPGAFMSMLGVSFLNKIVNERGITDPGVILTSLRENIVSAFWQKGALAEKKDGMDIALCSYDLKKRILNFSGANNPLYLIRKENGEFTHIERKGDMMPVGLYTMMPDFTSHKIKLEQGDTIYLFTDGFIDQFGGPSGKKFMKKNFIGMLLQHQVLDMKSQKKIFEEILDQWIHDPSEKNTHSEQIDDILILGIRV